MDAGREVKVISRLAMKIGYSQERTQANCLDGTVWGVWYNRHALTRNFILLLVVVTFASSTGCTASGSSVGGRATSTLRPYETGTSSPQPTPIVISTSASPTPGPTATPFVHVIQDGDTLIYIAYVHGITLEELLAANPGTDPRFLSVGSELIIPLPGGDEIDEPLPLVTPVPIALGTASCYRTLTNGLWCITTATGWVEGYAEGIAASIKLYDARGEEVASKTAYGPLNLLEPGETMPLATFFAPPAPEFSQVQSSLLTAFEYDVSEDRYLSVDVALDVLNALPGSTHWHLTGTVALASWETTGADSVALLVFAMSSSGAVVGFNMWESPGPVAPGDQVQVEIDLFSLGPPIASIGTLAEAFISQ
jgi:LysM repeat protein